MRITHRLAIGTAFVALAACGSHNSANNAAEMNAGTDLNAGSAAMNATDMNATGNADLNAAGAGAGTGTTNAAGNVSTNNASTNSY